MERESWNSLVELVFQHPDEVFRVLRTRVIYYFALRWLYNIVVGDGGF